MRQVAVATVLRAAADGFLTMLMTGILIFKAREALITNYRITEIWLYLPKEVRNGPPGLLSSYGP